MAELELQQVKCPSCKRVISSFSPFQAQVECPYCHEKSFNPLITAKKVPVPERIIRQTLTEEEFERKLVDTLVNTDFVPTDVFDHLTADKIFRAYLPMYLYEGIHDTQVVYRVEVDKVKEKRSTSFKDNFAYMALAYEGDEIPPELAEFARGLPYDPLLSKEYDPDLLGLTGVDDPVTLALNTDKEIIWAQYGRSCLQKHLQSIAKSSDRLSIPSSAEDLKVLPPAVTIHSTRYALVPYWFVYYNYDNRKYHFIMDGTGQHSTILPPIDEQARKKNNRLVGLAWTLAVVIFVLMLISRNFFTGLLVGTGVFIGLRWVAKRQRKKARALRMEGAKRLLGEQ